MRSRSARAGLLVALVLLAASAAAADEDPDRDDAFKEFLNWFTSSGGRRAPQLEVRTQDGVRGVYAASTVEAGAELCFVPRHLILRCPAGAEEDWLTQLDAKAVDASLWCLVVRLLRELRDPSSPWRPWLNVLPREVEVPLLDYSEDELAAFGDPRQLRRALETRSEVAAVAAGLERVAVGASEEELRWALKIALTRSWEGCGLVPFADLFNHDPDTANGGPRFEADGGDECSFAELQADRGYGAGEQVTISYGEKSGAMLLLYYGWLPPLPKDSLQFAVRPAPPAPPEEAGDEGERERPWSLLERALDARGLPAADDDLTQFVFVRHAPAVPDRLLDVYRAMAAAEMAAEGAGGAEPPPAGPMLGPGPAGPAVEERALRLLRAELQRPRPGALPLSPADEQLAGRAWRPPPATPRAAAAARSRAQRDAIMDALRRAVDAALVNLSAAHWLAAQPAAWGLPPAPDVE